MTRKLPNFDGEERNPVDGEVDSPPVHRGRQSLLALPGNG